MDYRIFPPEEILEYSASLPVSKSIVARRLILNYIAGGRDAAIRTPGIHANEDTEVLASALTAGLPVDGSTVDVKASGTALRFLTALCAALPDTDCVLTGVERLCNRPIAELVDVLRSLGAQIQYLDKEGFAPVRITGKRLSGGKVDVDSSVSSQFISALMMAAVLMDSPLEIALKGDVQSAPYIAMTGALLNRQGQGEVIVEPYSVTVNISGLDTDFTAPEPDWSAAAFWYEIAAVTAGWVTLPGLEHESIQGDSRAREYFERLGVLTEFTEEGAELSASPEVYSKLDCDLTDTPDMVPALAATCALLGIPFTFRGVKALQLKESDRLEALRIELLKIGCICELEDYGNVFLWDGKRAMVRELPTFETYGDHRIAMALAPVACAAPGIIIKDAEVVGKSYPEFWNQLRAAGFVVTDASEPIAEEDAE